jgi:type II secretory ATPase GspE/PulE/Tfp pilus assembly ATPase PilB-like protein
MLVSNCYQDKREIINTLRAIIQGKMVMRKCSDCQGDGEVYYSNVTGLVVEKTFGEKYYRTEDDPYQVRTDLCETCEGLGYVVAYVDD